MVCVKADVCKIARIELQIVCIFTILVVEFMVIK